jgi:Zn-dependent peptidase ImmA (M78 family)
MARLLEPEAGFSALTVCAGTRRLIVYNQRHPPGRRASSLAHELAHVILDHPPGPVLDSARARLWDETLEAEADWQAGALLVPREGAVAWLRRERGPAGGERHFGVSRALFLWRVYQTGAARQFGHGVRRLVTRGRP